MNKCAHTKHTHTHICFWLGIIESKNQNARITYSLTHALAAGFIFVWGGLSQAIIESLTVSGYFSGCCFSSPSSCSRSRSTNFTWFVRLRGGGVRRWLHIHISLFCNRAMFDSILFCVCALPPPPSPLYKCVCVPAAHNIIEISMNFTRNLIMSINTLKLFRQQKPKHHQSTTQCTYACVLLNAVELK